MSKICKLPGCNCPIPSNRKSSALYCSIAHYDEAKKLRSRKQYQDYKGMRDKRRKEEQVLEHLYSAQKHGAEISLEPFLKSGFDFGFSTGEAKGKNGEFVKLVGEYGYSIDAITKKVKLWKTP